jgi:hypothetical protein
MPGGDGTGPLGHGPMTGRGMGYCVVKLPPDGESLQGYAGVAGRPVVAGGHRDGEVASLRRLARSLETRLERIRARISDIEERGGPEWRRR